MSALPFTQTPRIYSGAPTLVVALPGWSLRDSLARVLSYYRTSSIIITLPGAVDDPEKGSVCYESSNFGISDKHIASSEKSSEKTLRPAFIVPPPVKQGGQVRYAKSKTTRRIRFQLWFNTYKKFFTFIVLLNLVGLILATVHVWQYPWKYTGALALGNFLTAVLMRNELFGRLLYSLVNKLFAKWTPLWFRLGCTSILQHLGGVHSGCAASGFAWLLFRLILAFSNRKDNPNAVLFAGIVTSIAMAMCIGSAFPWVRNTHHNVFERHHRFIGWFGLFFTWIFVALGDSYDANTHTWNVNAMPSCIGRTSGSASHDCFVRKAIHKFASNAPDYCFCFCSILTPWFTVRKVKVDVEVPSSKVAIIRFERGMQQGLLARVSRSSIMEYHAFGIVSTYAKHHYIICGVQGDFTRELVLNPPTHLWTRELKFAGVSNTSTLYRRGSVYAPEQESAQLFQRASRVEIALRQSSDWYLIWIGSEQEKTFGPTISGLIHRHLGPERMTLWDSKKRGGRPDIMRVVKEVYTMWRAEVVFITSNRQGNQEIMEGCKEARIPAFVSLARAFPEPYND
ncbi:hypothetical protein B0F90DRAFT_1816577 [Multifurca ochricompacta]|uniref:Non-ribosomal peptide synthetase n=1 Tax=Multifurca ochricompacta TaxID=376703 RepID=A0AAD4M7I7_9AGAM|nr:hypothetical protein B0F90DRAFT_1816577 [Multifurca ochricompacta]